LTFGSVEEGRVRQCQKRKDCKMDLVFERIDEETLIEL
jgi:hypothetical protein